MSLRIRSGFTPTAPKAVCFDLDNTLYAYDPANAAGMEAVYAKVKNTLGTSQKDAESAFSLAREEVKNQTGECASSHSRLLYFHRMLELLGLKSQIVMALDLEQTFWRSYLPACHIFPGVIDLLFFLRANDVTTAIITDLTAQIQFRKLIYLKLDSLFDYVITSEETAADKISGAPFALALRKMDMLGRDVWMVGDSCSSDIFPAEKLGMTGILKGARLSAEGGAAHIELDVFSDLAELFYRVFPTNNPR